MSLIDNLASIREMQGKPPLPSPHHIEGFGPNDPPVPESRPVPRDAVEVADPDVIDDGDEYGIHDNPGPPSPLIPLRPQPQPLAPPAPVPSQFNLAVGDRLAEWKGRAVLLTQDEEKEVRAVVLKAIQRELDADLAEVGRRRPRRSRPAPEPVSVDPAKPKRVRRAKP